VGESEPATVGGVKAKRLEAVASRALTPSPVAGGAANASRDDGASRLQTYQNGEVTQQTTDLALVGQRHRHKNRWSIRGSTLPTRLHPKARRAYFCSRVTYASKPSF
jgi:hypothetical protein